MAEINYDGAGNVVGSRENIEREKRGNLAKQERRLKAEKIKQKARDNIEIERVIKKSANPAESINGYNREFKPGVRLDTGGISTSDRLFLRDGLPLQIGRMQNGKPPQEHDKAGLDIAVKNAATYPLSRNAAELNVRQGGLDISCNQTIPMIVRYSCLVEEGGKPRIDRRTAILILNKQFNVDFNTMRDVSLDFLTNNDEAGRINFKPGKNGTIMSYEHSSAVFNQFKSILSSV